MMSVAWPRTFGAEDVEEHADDARGASTTTTAPTARGACMPSEPLQRCAEVLRLLAGHAGRAPSGPCRRSGRARLAASGSLVGRRLSSSSAHAASSSPICDSTISRVRRAGLEQLVVGAEPDDLAVLEHEDLVGVEIVDTRWATITTAASRGVAARARRGAGRRWRGRGPRTSRRTGRCSGLRTSARAMASRWRWPPDTLVPPWAMRRVEPAGHGARRSRRPGRPRAPPTSRRRWRRACRSAGCSRTVPENRYGFCGTRPMRLHSTSGSRSRTSTPSTSTAPVGGVEQAGDQVERASSCPTPVLPMMAVVWPGSAVKRDVAEHRLLGARVVEADVAQLERAALGQLGDRVLGGRRPTTSVSSTS